MGKKWMLVWLLGSGSAWALDCKITYQGVARSGWGAGKKQVAVSLYKNTTASDCGAKATEALKSQVPQIYTRERRITTKGRPSPLSRQHYITPTHAIWCVGNLWPLDLYFDEDDCENISQQSNSEND